MDQDMKSSSTWTPETCLRVKPVASVRVSADGTRAAFTVSEPVMTDEKSDYVAQIWLGSTAGADAYQATFGEKSSENPRWSPDDRYLAFTSKRGEKAQLYVMRMSGGEPEALTEGKSDVVDFKWAPDGQSIAVAMADAPTEEEEKRKKSKDDWSYKNEDEKFNRIYLISLEKDEEGKRPPRLLTPADRQVGWFDWSPTGTQIVYDHTSGPSADLWPSSQISIVDIASAQSTPLVEGTFAANRPFYSPDGRSVAFVRTDDPPRWYFRAAICVVSISGGDVRALPATFDENAATVGWTGNGESVLFAEPYRTTTRLYAVNVASGEIETLYSGGANVDFNLNTARDWVGLVHHTPECAAEAYATPLGNLDPRPISDVNAEMNAIPIAKTETIRWTGAKGVEIEGLLTFPAGYHAGMRVPLLLVIHGGPAGVFVENLPGMASVYPVAAFAQRGFAVLRCNPRGSSGYGADFRASNYKDWGGADYEDLMRGVDYVIDKGIADKDRLGVMGWSYGGYMTSWVITQTDRFKAASVGAAVTNLVSFNGTADIPSFLPDYFGGEFWHDAATYLDHSPVFQTKNVKTPALIQHGDADVRVPITQGHEYYNALKRQGVEVRMIVFPRQPHGITEPRMLLKAMQTNLDWFVGKLL